MKYKVNLVHSEYATVYVDANSEDEANDLALEKTPDEWEDGGVEAYNIEIEEDDESEYINEKLYTIATCNNARDIIPNAEHIERVDEVVNNTVPNPEEFDDFAAAKLAKSDGVKLINDIDGIYSNFYVDTLENRNIINAYIKTHPAELNHELIGIL